MLKTYKNKQHLIKDVGEFRFDEMGNDDNSFQYINNFLNKKSNVSITKEEEDAFKNVIFAFAGKN